MQHEKLLCTAATTFISNTKEKKRGIFGVLTNCAANCRKTNHIKS
jgi:hypothetical protein